MLHEQWMADQSNMNREGLTLGLYSEPNSINIHSLRKLTWEDLEIDMAPELANNLNHGAAFRAG